MIVYNNFINGLLEFKKTNIDRIDCRTFIHERKKKRDKEFLIFQESILIQRLSAKEKQYNSQKQKQIEDDIIGSLTLQQFQEQQQKSLNSQYQDVVIVKYTDGNHKILTEANFSEMMFKNVVNNFWREILFIQAFRNPKRGLRSFLRIRFIYENAEKDPLFKKALDNICLLGEKFSEDQYNFFNKKMQKDEQTFEKQLLETSDQDYCKYNTYKIVHFIQCYKKIKIEQMISVFMEDDYGNYTLVDCLNLLYKDILHLNQHDYVSKKIDLIDKSHQKVNTDQKSQKISEINSVMTQVFEQQKKKLGIELDSVIPYDPTSDQVFAILNPQAPVKLSQIIKESRQGKPELNIHSLNNFDKSVKQRFQRTILYNQDDNNQKEPQEDSFFIVNKNDKFENFLKEQEELENNQNDKKQLQSRLLSSKSVQTMISKNSQKNPINNIVIHDSNLTFSQQDLFYQQSKNQEQSSMITAQQLSQAPKLNKAKIVMDFFKKTSKYNSNLKTPFNQTHTNSQKLIKTHNNSNKDLVGKFLTQKFNFTTSTQNRLDELKAKKDCQYTRKTDIHYVRQIDQLLPAVVYHRK